MSLVKAPGQPSNGGLYIDTVTGQYFSQDAMNPGLFSPLGGVGQGAVGAPVMRTDVGGSSNGGFQEGDPGDLRRIVGYRGDGTPITAQDVASENAAQQRTTQAATARQKAAELAAANSGAMASMLSAQAAMARLGLDDKISLRDLQEKMREFDISTAEGRRQFDQTLAQRAREFDTTENRERAALILNAPKGPADAFTYLARMQSLAQRGFVTDTLRSAIQSATGMTMDQLKQSPVLTNTQLAVGLTDAISGRQMDSNVAGFLSRTFGTPNSAVAQAQQVYNGQGPITAPTAEQLVSTTNQLQANASQQNAYLSGPARPEGMSDAWQWDPQRGDFTHSGAEGSTVLWNNGTPLNDTSGLYQFGVPKTGLTQAGYASSPAIRLAADAVGSGGIAPPAGSGPIGSSGAVQVPEPTPTGDPEQDWRNYAWYVANSTFAANAPGSRPGGANTPQELAAMIYAQNYSNPLSQGYTPTSPLGTVPATTGTGGTGSSFLLQNPPTGFQTSAQEFGKLEPSTQAAYLNLISESGGEMPEDFLSGLRKGALNFKRSNAVRFG
jgi:hypothetical protein